MSPTKKTVRGTVLAPVLIVSSLALIVAAAAMSSGTNTTSKSIPAPLATSLVTLAPSGRQVVAALHQAGLEPSALAACGVTPSQTAEIKTASRAWADEHELDLRGANEDARVAGDDHNRLRALVQSGRATAQDVTGLDAASTALAQAQAARAALIGDLVSTATATLSSDQQATLSAIRGNSSWQLPVELQCIERTQAQWVELRSALAAERIAARKSEPLDGAIQSYLLAARSVQAVAMASINKASHLAQIKAAFDDSAGW